MRDFRAKRSGDAGWGSPLPDLGTYNLCIRLGTGRLSQAVVVSGLHAYESVFIHTSCLVGQSDGSDELMERE